MTVDREQVEIVLIRRCGALMTAADLDGSTITGNNNDLNDPIGYALRRLGQSVADISNVTDADLSGVADTDIDKLLDLAETRTLGNILGNLDDVDITLGPRRESLNQLAELLEKRLERLQKKIEREYGIGLGSFESGVISMDFAEHNETVAEEV